MARLISKNIVTAFGSEIAVREIQEISEHVSVEFSDYFFPVSFNIVYLFQVHVQLNTLNMQDKGPGFRCAF